jgi:hypothetical protein
LEFDVGDHAEVMYRELSFGDGEVQRTDSRFYGFVNPALEIDSRVPTEQPDTPVFDIRGKPARSVDREIVWPRMQVPSVRLDIP